MLKDLIIIAVMACLLVTVPNTAAAQTDSLPQVYKVTRHRGWKISGQDQCSTPLKTTAEQVDGVTVQTKTFQCVGELPLAEIEFYYSNGGGELFVRTELLALRNLWSYSIDGQTFAYRAAYIKVDIQSDGSREYAGVIFLLNYYDEDADGKFETRYGKLPNIKIPNWYKGK
jgi:hypothetical protein